jgi:phosphomannomutase/phosphoglucomutase
MTERHLFGTNGIRGVVNQDMTTEFAAKVGAAIGSFFNGGEIFVGRDGRTSSFMLQEAVVSGLLSVGCRVYELGLAPMPAVQFAVKHFKPDGGVMITASHNPPEFNGIKVIDADGVEISREKEIEIEKIFFEEAIKWRKWNQLGTIVTKPDIIHMYIEAIKTHVDVEAIKKAHLRVVADPGNGVGALAAPQLLRELGCEVITINADVDGNFPGRLPEPTPDHLENLSKTVQAVGADLGVAFDGDADRAIFTDEKGEVHWGDRSFALIEKFFLMKHPGETIVTPVSSSQVVSDIANEYGGKIHWTRVGSVTVARTMVEIGAKLGGEENGGIFYGPHQPVRDGAMATALILDVMAKSGEKLRKLLFDLPMYYNHKGKVTCPNNLKKKVLDSLLEQVKGLQVETTDGAKIRFSDGSWILIRPSGTEPVYRLFAEATSKEKAVSLVEHYTKVVSELIETEAAASAQ